MLKHARANLRHPPQIRTETAIQQNRGAIKFYEQGIFDFIGDSPQRVQVEAVAKDAAAALKEHQTYLEKTLLPASTGDWRIGKERFAKKLAMVLDAGVTADEVLADAEQAFEQVHRDMLLVARQLWPQYFPGKAVPADDEAGRQATI